MLLAHLEVARKHVAEGEAHLAKQRKVIADLLAGGLTTNGAETFLAHLEASQTAHLDIVRRIEEQLGTTPPE